MLTPAVTLAVCVPLGLEKFTLPLASSVTLITAGTGLATVLESSTAAFSWTGFWLFFLSVLLEAIRVVCIQLLLGRLKFNQAEVLVYLGAPTAIMLLLASSIVESGGLLNDNKGLHLLRSEGRAFAASMSMGALVNLATALAIQNTSSLSFKVFGCVKNIFVVLYGVLAGDAVSVLQNAGYGASIIGFAWYAHSKQRAAEGSGPVKKFQ